MILTIDIGNTCTKLVAFEGDEIVESLRIEDNDWTSFLEFVNRFPFTEAIYSSVIKLDAQALAVFDGLSFPVTRLISGVTPIPVENQYVTPYTLGTDRLAAAIGAYFQKKGSPLLIIDIGTCITYDFVSESGSYLGGNISPGVAMRLKALPHFTSSLPLVEEIGELTDIGKTTELAIRNGVIHGVEYEIHGYVRRYLLKYPNLLVYLTGGGQLNLHISEKNSTFADDYLVSRGLNYILRYQHQLNNTTENGK